MEKLDIIPLTDRARSAIDAAIEHASNLTDQPPPLDAATVQALYDVLLGEDEVTGSTLISIGVAFGELIRQKSGYEWVRVSDDYGEENALSPEGANMVLYPISMIQKRLNASETVDIVALRDGAIDHLEKKLKSGDYQTR